MTNGRPPLWKQLLGALGGGALALALYGGYTVAKPQLHTLTGWLVLPQSRIDSDAIGDVRIAEADLSDDEVTRIAARAQRIAADFSGNYNAAAPAVEQPTQPALAPIEMIPMEDDSEEMIAEAQAHMEEMMMEEDDHHDDWNEDEMQMLMQYEEEKFYGETAALPDSGIGAWLAALVAFAGAGVALVRRKCAPVHQQA